MYLVDEYDESVTRVTLVFTDFGSEPRLPARYTPKPIVGDAKTAEEST
jgi:hypothetical protein